MAIDKSRILKHLQTEVYCRLGVSPIHGIGVFAIRDIPKGTHPLVSLLKIKEFSFSKKEIKKLPASVQKEVRMFCYYDKDEHLIPSIGLNAMCRSEKSKRVKNCFLTTTWPLTKNITLNDDSASHHFISVC